jgi:hypothetical protein
LGVAIFAGDDDVDSDIKAARCALSTIQLEGTPRVRQRPVRDGTANLIFPDTEQRVDQMVYPFLRRARFVSTVVDTTIRQCVREFMIKDGILPCTMSTCLAPEADE